MRHPPIEGPAAADGGAVFGRWKRPKKSPDTGQNPAKWPTYRNVTVERTPTLPCCRDIKTAKSGPTGTTPVVPQGSKIGSKIPLEIPSCIVGPLNGPMQTR